MAILKHVIGHLEDGEPRDGQAEMCEAVHEAMTEDWHLVAQAGTGTGKSLAYLVPAILHEGLVVVATATKTLQDQLLHHDIPLIARALDRDVRAVTLKGRSNYLCVQKLQELRAQGEPGRAGDPDSADLQKLLEWSEITTTGDRSELKFEPRAAAWDAVSVSGRECPGRWHCPSAASCHSERAKNDARDADLVIVNTHLYCMYALKRLPILPPHDVVVIDEAHELDHIASSVAGGSVSIRRFKRVSKALGPHVDEQWIADLDAAADRIDWALLAFQDRPLPAKLPAGLAEAAASATEALYDAIDSLGHTVDDSRDRLRYLQDSGDPAAEELSVVLQRQERALRVSKALYDDLVAASTRSREFASWVESNHKSLIWRSAPVEIAETLRTLLWPRASAVLCSATIPPNFPRAWGLDAGEFEVVNVGSPFDYRANSLMYVPNDLPRPGTPRHDDALNDEMEALINAAEGRTLALFTSYRAMDRAAEVLRSRLRWPIITQRDFPKPELLRRFADDTETCLFGVASLWQGVDIPGESLSLLIIARLPFPRPDDPLLTARRARWGDDAFRQIDLPLAATRLAQGAGRLIRTSTDRGVVAVLDSRLAKAGYRGILLSGLPPFPTTSERSEVEDFLSEILTTAH